MYAQALLVTLRMLVFRNGPQDFPYAAGLTPVLAALAVAVNSLVFSRVLPPPMAVGMAVALVVAIAFVTRVVLRLRKLENRFQQTFNALLATSAVLTLALLPPIAQVAPQILELARHPELLNKPDAVPLAAGPVFMMNLLNFWNFAVTGHIFRHAANVSLWVGLLLAFIAGGIMLFVGVVGGTLAGAMFGVTGV
jgi:hypothetical protein